LGHVITAQLKIKAFPRRSCGITEVPASFRQEQILCPVFRQNNPKLILFGVVHTHIKRGAFMGRGGWIGQLAIPLLEKQNIKKLQKGCEYYYCYYYLVFIIAF